MKMDVLARIRQLLDERNWSLYKLSKESGVPQSTLSNLFSRNNHPSINTLEVICKGFGISLAQFFSVDGEPMVLDSEQILLLERWSKLSSEQRKAFLDLMK